MISHPDKPRARYFRQLKRNVAQPLVKVYPYMQRSFVCLLLAAVIAGLAVYGSKRIAKSDLQLAVSGLAVDLSKSTTIWVIVHAAQIRVINKVESFSAELQ